jgi:hypothetical protein
MFSIWFVEAVYDDGESEAVLTVFTIVYVESFLLYFPLIAYSMFFKLILYYSIP